MIIGLLSWIAAGSIILAYAMAAKRPAMFDWANALGAPFILVPQVLGEAYGPATLTVFFGGIGWTHVWRRRRKQITKMPAPERGDNPPSAAPRSEPKEAEAAKPYPHFYEGRS